MPLSQTAAASDRNSAASSVSAESSGRASTISLPLHGPKMDPISELVRRFVGNSETAKHAFAGAGAGFATALITSPLDVVKARLQNQGRTEPGSKPLYRGTFGTLKFTWKSEGIRGLFSGIGPTMLGYLPSWTIYFVTYNRFQDFLISRTGFTANSSMTHMLAAVVGGVTSTVCCNPLWVIKTRLMTQGSHTNYHYASTFDAFAKIYRTEGMHGFYKGIVPSLWGVSHVAVQFPLYEKLKSILTPPGKEASASSILISSSAAKVVASVITYPHEVVRTRLQNQSTHPYKYTGLLHAIRLMYTEEGLLAFYKGMGTNLLRVVPAAMITFLSYEVLVDYQEKLWDDCYMNKNSTNT